LLVGDPLSCHRTTTTAGTPGTVVTVFTGEPVPPLSEEAREFHRRCGLGDDDAVARRTVEDDRAMATVGAAPVRLGVPDALYREDSAGNPRMSRVSLDSEAELIAHVARLMADEPAVRDAELVLAPLAIGNHIDHRVTRAAAQLLDRGTDTILWYEDVPYVLYPPELRQPIDDSHVDPRLCRLTPEQWRTKLRGIDCYASQLAILLGGDTTALPKYLTMYAEGLGDGVPAERYWRLPGNRRVPFSGIASPALGTVMMVV
jgi:LmbE family N-acetylglucosaminyl deacetylase